MANTIKVLRENYLLDDYNFNIIQYEIEKRIWFYGNHLKNSKDITKKKNNFKSNIRKNLRFFLDKVTKKNIAKNNIISNSFFSMNEKLSDLGFSIYNPPWKHINFRDEFKEKINSYRIRQICDEFNFKFHNGYTLSELINNINNDVKYLEFELEKFFIDNDIKALFIPYDSAIFESIAINTTKKIGKKSFLPIHGLPANYSKNYDNKTDYLLVWGEQIKKNYINCGFDEKKIIVSGHPNYSVNLCTKEELKFSLEKILVINKPMGDTSLTYKDEMIRLHREHCLLYLFSLQKVLKKIGVYNVRLRIHPSERSEWYEQFIDTRFYEIDKLNLHDSINNSSLLIGPTSSVFLESIYYNTNYIVYEPSLMNNFHNFLAPPFDKTDIRVPVAFNEEELIKIIKDKKKVDKSFLYEYINREFNIDFLKELIS